MDAIRTTLFKQFPVCMRVLAGVGIALSSCLHYAHIHKVLPSIPDVGFFLIFGVLGAVWGVWAGIPGNLNFSRTVNALSAGHPSHRRETSNRGNLRALDIAARGALYFSAFGVFGYASRVFGTLDERELILPRLLYLSGAMFCGLFIGAIIKAISGHLDPVREGAPDRSESWDREVLWYMAYCACVLFSVILVLGMLRDPA